jgi:hypothetical protein
MLMLLYGRSGWPGLAWSPDQQPPSLCRLPDAVAVHPGPKLAKILGFQTAPAWLDLQQQVCHPPSVSVSAKIIWSTDERFSHRAVY